jgi:DNA-binding MarR family transcriptional regulator
MSYPPLPSRFSDTRLNRVANQLHSAAIRLLRSARTVDSSTGLTSERLSLLSVLCFAGPRTVGKLADAEMVSRPAISRILNGLEDSGLARRERASSDRRRVVVHATAKGRRLMEAARRRRLQRVSDELSVLNPRELGVLEAASNLLGSLDERLGRGN